MTLIIIINFIIIVDAGKNIGSMLKVDIRNSPSPVLNNQ